MGQPGPIQEKKTWAPLLLLPFAHRPRIRLGRENNQSDTRSNMTLLPLQRFQPILDKIFTCLFPLGAVSLPACRHVVLSIDQAAKHGQDHGTYVCSQVVRQSGSTYMEMQSNTSPRRASLRRTRE